MDTRRSSPEGEADGWPWLAGILAVAGLGAALDAYGYWPGILIEDSRAQYTQAVRNAFEDWHPPLMAWIWRRLMLVGSGPAPMLALQLLLYWAGFAIAGAWAWRRGRSGAGIALAAVGWLPGPLELMGAVMKDALMAGSLVSASGLLLWQQTVRSRAAYWALTVGVFAAMAVAAALRFNAFLACIPLVAAAVPRRWVETKARLAATGLCAGVAMLSMVPAVNAVVQAERTGIELALIMFDLGGVTERSGVNQFPDMGLDDPVAANHRCYDVVWWNPYAPWATEHGVEQCRIGFNRFKSTMEDEGVNPAALWLRAVVDHPLAYAAHRLAHFNVSTSFLVGRTPFKAAMTDSVPNPWGYRVQPNGVLAAIHSAATTAGHTPLGWPIVWISMGLAVLLLAVSTKSAAATQAIAASSALYGLGYMVFGVATELRYHIWTLSGAGLAGVLLLADLKARVVVPSRKAGLVAAAAIAGAIAMAMVARLVLR